MGKKYQFFIGTYTYEESEGVYMYSINSKGYLSKKGIVAKTDNPSFITKSHDGQYLLLVNENGGNNVGTIESYAIHDETLSLLDKKTSGGMSPCFININQQGHVLTANYGSGSIGFLQLKSTGKLSNLLYVQQHTGKGSNIRQEGPHAHSVWFEEDENNIISIDLGSNKLYFSKIDYANKKLIYRKQHKLTMPAGSGPRHLAWHPNKKWFYVINELSSTISLIKKTDNVSYEIDNSISTLPKTYKLPNTSAEIIISSDGEFIYASNRGHNSVVIFKVNHTNGRLTAIRHESVRGVGPRNFVLTPDENFLILANQKTNSLVSFKRNKTNGLLSYIDQIMAPTPVCILF
ncbi:lactonase family protein [Zobellia alginiliquefaciens]|uniref:lactonase family protein n=1 Tax=Zobellia alginiliquefaciens TaxID=3032586 RepID=UPI0023E3AA57|nr:lactonase family protein [Zobellia alginiliquefaciens]